MEGYLSKTDSSIRSNWSTNRSRGHSHQLQKNCSFNEWNHTKLKSSISPILMKQIQICNLNNFYVKRWNNESGLNHEGSFLIHGKALRAHVSKKFFDSLHHESNAVPALTFLTGAVAFLSPCYIWSLDQFVTENCTGTFCLWPKDMSAVYRTVMFHGFQRLLTFSKFKNISALKQIVSSNIFVATIMEASTGIYS